MTAIAGRPPTLALLAWMTGAGFFFYAWILRVAPSVMIEELMRDFAVGAAAVGNLSAFYFYGYAGMQVPVGMLIDRFGPRRLMTVSAALCAGGCVIFALSTAFTGLAFGRFLIGASAAISLVGAMAVAGQWFPARRFALFSGLTMMMGMVGGVFGQAPLRLLVEATDWRNAVLLLAAGGVMVALAAWSTVRDRQRGSGGLGPVLAGTWMVMGNRQTWFIAFAGLGATGPLLGFAGLWGVPYFTASYGVDAGVAASITSTLFIGWGVGAPWFGWLSDRIQRRRAPFIAGMTLCLASLATLVYLPGLPLAGVTALCFLCGFGGAAQIVGFAAVREHNAVHLSGTALGFVNGMVTGAGALYQPLLGWLLDLAWDGRLEAGARIYDPGAYQAAFGVLVAGSFTGLLCAIAMVETHCRQRG
jgi:MFS family permease